MTPGTRGTRADRTGGHTIQLTQSLTHSHWHADTEMLAIAASDILMNIHLYHFPLPGSVDAGVLTM